VRTQTLLEQSDGVETQDHRHTCNVQPKIADTGAVRRVQDARSQTRVQALRWCGPKVGEGPGNGPEEMRPGCDQAFYVEIRKDGGCFFLKRI